MFDKRYQVNQTFFTDKQILSRVEAVMPNKRNSPEPGL